MKYSKLFGKTVRESKSDMTLKSHKLLYQAGFIRESRAGRYYLLPLGQKVQDKICKVIENEMNKAGAQKMFAPLLHPIELWQETNRDSAGGYELMTVSDRAGAKFALGGTAEEMFVDVVRGFQISYKDLPINVYQFGYKFRDELRARGGLLRVREFVMKDAYSFHSTEEDFEREYHNMWNAYVAAYTALGLNVQVVPADNGYFGGDYCHEFVIESEVGESKYFVSEDESYIAHEDVACFKLEAMNNEDDLLPLEEIDQPEWVKTMEDNQKHYEAPLFKYLKNVVYKNRVNGELFVVVIRGDLDVNKNKLEQVLSLVGLLEDATAEDLESIGAKPGYVRSWGHKNCTYVADLSLTTVKNFIGGQKSNSRDVKNVNYQRDFKHELEFDLALAQDGFMAPDAKSSLIAKKGIEVGNIFQLGQHYSKLMANAVFTDSDGTLKPYYMGCYGIGVGRTMATIAEVMSDDKGLIWPKNIAPFQVQVVPLDSDGPVFEAALSLYNELIGLGYEVLLDDREVRPGVKFADSDLIGTPVRCVISKKTLEQDKFEYKLRSESEFSLVSKDELLNNIETYYG